MPCVLVCRTVKKDSINGSLHYTNTLDVVDMAYQLPSVRISIATSLSVP